MSKEEKWAMLMKHEGFELDPYEDSLGYLTGGVGHKMTKEDLAEFDPKWDKDKKQTYWAKKFVEDYKRSSTKALSYMQKYNIPPDDSKHFVLTSMMFQLGPSGGHFPEMFKKLGEGDVQGAIEEMKTNKKKTGPSRWYAQTPNRVEALAKILESS